MRASYGGVSLIVSLFAPLEKHWASMHVFTQNLAKNLPSGVHVSRPFIPYIRLPLASLERRSISFFKHIVYPNVAHISQGAINHITDHSYSFLIKKIDPKRTLVTCHDLIPLNFFEESIRDAFLRDISPIRDAAAIVADSKKTKADIVEKLGIEEKKIRVVPLGVDHERFFPFDEKRKRCTRAKFGFGSEFVVLHVGSTLPYKNIEGIIHALSLIEDEILFVKVGWDFTAEQKKFIDKKGIRKKISYIGKLKDAQMPEIYNACDLLVFPSFNEGFGLPIIEAMACGLPVLTSNSGGCEETAGDAGILVEPSDAGAIADAIMQVMQSKDFACEISKKGLKRAAEFSWKRTAEEYMHIYTHIIKSLKR
ncbi:MAG: glycosyltransferase family 1 protein [Candidatus Micrarchaeia archaeon]